MSDVVAVMHTTRIQRPFDIAMTAISPTSSSLITSAELIKQGAEAVRLPRSSCGRCSKCSGPESSWTDRLASVPPPLYLANTHHLRPLHIHLLSCVNINTPSRHPQTPFPQNIPPPHPQRFPHQDSPRIRSPCPLSVPARWRQRSCSNMGG